ncbi:amidohydrolase family protein [Sphingosinicella terrae]|uniref:amidohydrolase family protein n=1 Tax=Sphingosinicella terrae TaxID=2172047 RepID=UPI000E0CD3C9|nr:amidohydrolase family protein [Sphingosinicella terrae]
MLPFRLLAALLLAATPAFALQRPAAEAPAPALELRGGLWFDGERFSPGSWYSIDGRLTASRPERIDAVLDLTGRFILPSLIEAHNHDAQSGRFGAISNAKNMHAGIFHSIQLCSRPSAREDYGGFFGQPGMMTVRYAEACLSAADGHPLGIALASSRQFGIEMEPAEARRFYDPVDTLADLDRLWPELLERRPRLIKIILINSERRAQELADPSTFGFRGIDPALVVPIVERAHRAGIRVVAHADTAADFAIAVRAGADIIAHLPGYRIAPGMNAANYRLSDAIVAEAARRGTIVITTAGVARHDMARRPENAATLQALQRENLRLLRDAGVTLALGSDDVMGTVVDELVYLDGLGIFPRGELLRRATADTARAMFPEAAIGRFAEGAEANLLAFDGDPTVDIEILRRPVLRVQRGMVLGR